MMSSTSCYSRRLPIRVTGQEPQPPPHVISVRSFCELTLNFVARATQRRSRRGDKRGEAVASVRLQRAPIPTALLGQSSILLHYHHRRVFHFLFLFHPLAWRLLPFRCPGKLTRIPTFPPPAAPVSPSALTAGLRLLKETEKDTFTALWPFDPCLSPS